MGERREDSEADDYLEECQSLTHYRYEGGMYPRISYGLETFRDPVEAGRKPCRHCGAVKGQLHHPLCDYEQCPVCGNQVMGCGCGILVEDAVRAEPSPQQASQTNESYRSSLSGPSEPVAVLDHSAAEASWMVGGKTSFQLLAVTIVCTDLARSVRFYEQALGAVREADDGYGCPWFKLGSVPITLLHNATMVSPAKFPEHPMAMLWVETDDLTTAARRFAHFGVKVLNPSDGQSMIIADPDGIVIEVWQAAPEDSVGNAERAR